MSIKYQGEYLGTNLINDASNIAYGDTTVADKLGNTVGLENISAGVLGSDGSNVYNNAMINSSKIESCGMNKNGWVFYNEYDGSKWTTQWQANLKNFGTNMYAKDFSLATARAEVKLCDLPNGLTVENSAIFQILGKYNGNWYTSSSPEVNRNEFPVQAYILSDGLYVNNRVDTIWTVARIIFGKIITSW